MAKQTEDHPCIFGELRRFTIEPEAIRPAGSMKKGGEEITWDEKKGRKVEVSLETPNMTYKITDLVESDRYTLIPGWEKYKPGQKVAVYGENINARSGTGKFFDIRLVG